MPWVVGEWGLGLRSPDTLRPDRAELGIPGIPAQSQERSQGKLAALWLPAPKEGWGGIKTRVSWMGRLRQEIGVLLYSKAR